MKDFIFMVQLIEKVSVRLRQTFRYSERLTAMSIINYSPDVKCGNSGVRRILLFFQKQFQPQFAVKLSSEYPSPLKFVLFIDCCSRTTC